MKAVIPREHGAWGMLFAPLLVGMFAGGLAASHVLLVLSMLGVYLASYPLIQWFKNPKRNAHLRGWILGYGAASAVLGLPLVYLYPKLVWLALPAAVVLMINIGFAVRKQERHILNDLVAISGLSLGGVAAYYVSTNGFDLTSGVIWLSCFLVFTGSVLHVKSLIREKGNRTIKAAANIYHVLLVALPIAAEFAFPELLPYKWMSLAFAFSAIKVWVTPFNKPMRSLTIGMIEIANTVWFAISAGIVLH
ncbi:YwiC-like family protein [Effusibacillus lacus]|uniref:YwiC-like family protein n=1 Tax=Effusibacillus lacus TaxID=1348429 RepID=A0A292YSE2_9BACL|nr:YwiC-like family protein [Effusibacillus lacus]TCS76096.1 YwiC-like protein [Effusibacillus lacus]GAX91390.1 hypothetical protein EFBL_3059 [Effusibacillus lacus]